MKNKIFILLSIISFLSVFTLFGDTRPAKWATPMELKGVTNLFKINDNIYRSAQPNSTGFEELKKIGIKTIINLRFFHSDKKLISSKDINTIHIYMLPTSPQEEEIVSFLKIISDAEKGPFLIHCQHGSDRTGTMIAIYRIVFEGWTKDEAIEEMTKGGYGFHPVFNNLPVFIKNLDIEKIKNQAGIK